ncbi:MAG: STT3 domain-containing protein [Desulfonauticus sp.]|nr:STT3 domain-containing protein [Desulfonauticus sp.]
MESRKNIFYCLFIFFITYFLGCSLRMWEFQFWNNPAFFIHNEPLMATHDAYAWLAGAIGVGPYVGSPMSQILQCLHAITGINLATISFWLPVFVAPLACVPVILVCAMFKRIEAGIVAGIITALGPGYFLRTRIGYGDTDILTLFFPLLYCASLIFWLKPFLGQWSKVNEVEEKILNKHNMLGAVYTGVTVFGYQWFYPNGYPIIMYSFILMFFLSLILCSKRIFIKLLPGFAIILSLGFGGIWGWVLSILYLLLEGKQIRWSKLNLGVVFFVLSIIVFFLEKGEGAILSLIEPVLNYARISSFFKAETSKQVLKLPDVLVSVKEAQTVDWNVLINRVGQGPFVFVPGIIGYIWACMRFPVLLAFLPQIGLALLSVKLGNRFTMYGPPVIGIGLGLGIGFLLDKIRISRKAVVLIIYLVLAIPLLLPSVNLAKKLRPVPVLPKVYALSLKELNKLTPKDAMLWLWWDYGYAAQYYAQRKTFADGGAHSGPYLYPLALVHSTDSPRQANQVIKFIAQDEQEQIEECIKNGTKPAHPEAKVIYWPVDPVRKLNLMGPEKAQLFIDSLRNKEIVQAPDIPAQYVIFSWENIRLGYWITYFGNWNLITGKGIHSRIQTVYGGVNIDLKNGYLNWRQKKIPLLKLLIIDKKTGRSREKVWPQVKGVCALYNSYINKLILVDRSMYDSLMVQMLLKDPEEFNPYFTLVVDRFPWVRIYKVN